jgi:exonuclease VII large subunit
MFTKKDVKSEWEKVYDYISVLSVGDEIDYADLDLILGRDFRSARTPFVRANKELLERNQRGMLNVRGVGYRVVTASEHEAAAKRHHKSARRQLTRAHQWVKNADRSQLTPEERQRFDRIELSLSRQLQHTKALEERVQKMEQATAAVVEKTNGVETDVAELKASQDKIFEALRRLGYQDT